VFRFVRVTDVTPGRVRLAASVLGWLLFALVVAWHLPRNPMGWHQAPESAHVPRLSGRG